MKNVVIALFGFVFILVVLYAIFPVFALRDFAKIEEQEIVRDVAQARNLLDTEFQQLSVTVGDYAGWDDTYAFVQDENLQFIEDNLTKQTFSKLRLNVLMIVDNAGVIVFESGHDYRVNAKTPLPATLRQHLAPGKPLLTHRSTESVVSGLLALPEGLLLVVSRPILTSDYQGPIRGVLVMGRILDDVEIARLGRILQLKLTVVPMVAARALPASQGIWKQLGGSSEAQPVAVQVEGGDLIAGYALLTDLYGTDVGFLKVEAQRAIYRHAKQSTVNFIILYVITGLAFAVAITLLGKRLVRIRRQERQATEQLEELNRQLSQRVRQAVEEMRRKDQVMILKSRQAAMGEMINNIAHQWRQPLNALGLVLADLNDAHASNELDRDYVEKATATGNRLVRQMSATIDDFRNFFLPGKERVAFSARKQILETIALVETSFVSNDIVIRYEADNDVTLYGFPNEYSQVLLNLLSNAREAILASGAPAGAVDIRLSIHNEQGYVSITDNGGGIPEEQIPRIFEPYFSTKSQGTGIGLYMSKMIIAENMNGSISVRNVKQGAEFTVMTPLARDGQ